MDLSDLESLLEPLSPEEPCGPDLEYDPEFGEMDRAAQPKAEQQFGDTIVAAEPPDWKEVRKRAESLLQRTKDMRVVVYLARARLNLDGLNGFHESIRLLRGYLESFWDSVHPELDHDDNDDPTYRTNTLITLCDEETILRELQEAPLVSSRAVGQFSLRDVHHAREASEAPPRPAPADSSWGDDSGESAEPAPKGPSQATIDAAFTDADNEEIQQTEEASRGAAEDLAAIEQFVTEQVGVSLAVSLKPVCDVLKEINEVVAGQLQRLGVGVEEESADEPQFDESAPAGDGSGDAATVSSPAAKGGYRVNGKITSRKDAIKALDDVCDFYEENEPSSPLPLLIRRAQRLASKSFLDILRDLAPDAVAQAEALSGSGGESHSDSSGGYASDSSAEESSSSSDNW